MAFNLKNQVCLAVHLQNKTFFVCRTCVAHVSLMLPLCCLCVSCVALVLHLYCLCRILATLVLFLSHSCYTCVTCVALMSLMSSAGFVKQTTYHLITKRLPIFCETMWQLAIVNKFFYE